MAITPMDIRKKTFTAQRHGLAKAEVEEFVEEVATEMESLRKERAQLNEKVEELAARVAGYEKTEQLLKDTLLTAQKATGQLREEAKKEAELVVEKAKLEAERMRHEAEQQIRHLGDDLRTLEAKRSALSDEIAAIARTYLALAERMSDRKRGCGADEGRSQNPEVRMQSARSGAAESDRKQSAEAADSAKRTGDKS